MASTYTDEELYLHYRALAPSHVVALQMVADHRIAYPQDAIDTEATWDGLSPAERDAAIIQATRRAAQLPSGAERGPSRRWPGAGWRSGRHDPLAHHPGGASWGARVPHGRRLARLPLAGGGRDRACAHRAA
jgi:hypothetical protein